MYYLQVVSWIITIWIFGSLTIFLLARVLGGEVGMLTLLSLENSCTGPVLSVHHVKLAVLFYRLHTVRFLESLDIRYSH